MLPKPAESVDAIEGFTYRVLDGDVHEFTLGTTKTPQKALNAYFNRLEVLFAPSPTDRLLRMLMVLDGKVPPLSQTVQRARDLIQQHPDRPPTRTAILTVPGVFARLGDTMIRMLRLDERRHAIRIFNLEQRAEALAWVLAADPMPTATQV